MDLFVLDARETWQGPLIEVARRRGWRAKRIFSADDVTGDGYGFIRPHADPDILPGHREDDLRMRQALTMFQDRAQIEVYENKSEQFRRWGKWMPETWRVTSEAELAGLDLPFPLVSKADEGASSYNVRILPDRAALDRHAGQVFGPGLRVDCCAGGPGGRQATTTQKDYLLLQRFIPHGVTWRVNIVGRQYAIFRRFCYPDRPVAQTGNVEPVKVLDDLTNGLLDYAKRIFADIGTKWCALDILRDGSEWKLLETSLAWPWPSPGDCNNGLFFPCRRRWIDMMEVLLDEAEAGVWGG